MRESASVCLSVLAVLAVTFMVSDLALPPHHIQWRARGKELLEYAAWLAVIGPAVVWYQSSRLPSDRT